MSDRERPILRSSSGVTATVLGHAGGEAKMSKDGKSCSVQVAIERRYQQDGEWKSDTTWWTVWFRGDAMVEKAKTIRKGDLVQVLVRGVKPEDYEKDGQWFLKVSCNAISFPEIFTWHPAEEGSSGNSGSSSGGSRRGSSSNRPSEPVPDPNDDVPF